MHQPQTTNKSVCLVHTACIGQLEGQKQKKYTRPTSRDAFLLIGLFVADELDDCSDGVAAIVLGVGHGEHRSPGDTSRGSVECKARGLRKQPEMMQTPGALTQSTRA